MWPHQKLSGSWNDRPVTRNLDPPFLIPPVQIYRNIWTPRIIYFNFAEIFGPSRKDSDPDCLFSLHLVYTCNVADKSAWQIIA